MKHASSQSLEVNRGELFTKGVGASKDVLGQVVKIKVAKNKLGQPYNTATLDLYYATGIDKIMELVEVAKLVGVLQGTSWLKYIDTSTGEIKLDKDGNEYKWNGVNKVVEAIKDDLSRTGGDLYNEMYQVVNKVLRG